MKFSEVINSNGLDYDSPFHRSGGGGDSAVRTLHSLVRYEHRYELFGPEA